MNSAAVGLGETPVKKGRSSSDVTNSEATNKDLSYDPTLDKKREQYLSWEDYFMAVACLSAQRSKDPSTQVGACIVSPEKKIVGIGYNGMPNGCPDDQLPWGKTSPNPLETKYPYVCHAEMNAIMNKNSADVKGCTMYVALFPCNECAKLIIQAGIKTIIYRKDKPEKPEMIASKRLFDMVGIEYRKFETQLERIEINFKDPSDSCTIISREGSIQSSQEASERSKSQE